MEGSWRVEWEVRGGLLGLGGGGGLGGGCRGDCSRCVGEVIRGMMI